MPTQRGNIYKSQLTICQSITLRQLEGLTDEDMLLQPQPRGNCASWVLAHIIASRDAMYRHLEKDFIWDEETSKQYSYGSEPITSADDPYILLADLLVDYQATTEFLVDCFDTITDEELDRVVDDKGATVADKLTFLVWHESYHTGQFEQLRQLTGVDDKVI